MSRRKNRGATDDQGPDTAPPLTTTDPDTAWQDAQESPGIWQKLVRLVSSAPPEEHDRGRALRRAVRAMDVDAVRQMIARGYGVNESQEASLACIAARRMHMEMLDLLAEAGVDINRQDRRSQNSKARSPLQEAARKGWTDGVRRLLTLGAEVDQCEDGDVTALHIATRMGNADVVHLLLRNRADPCGAKSSTSSPLHEAPTLELVDMLLAAGACINQPDRNKCTPLHLQAYHGRPETVKRLLGGGADANARDRKGRTPVFLIGGRGDQVATFHALRDAGADLDLRDAGDNTLAHACADRAISVAFLAAVAQDTRLQWFEKNAQGLTPLDTLSARGHKLWALEIERYLRSGQPA